MPNRPDNPYERFPLTAALGLFLMLSGAVALLFLSSTWQDWRQAVLGAMILFALIGLALVLRRLKLRPLTARKAKPSPIPEAPPSAELQSFDPAGFIEAAKRRHPVSAPRQIGGRVQEERTAEAAPQARIGAQTIRRLPDLRDHPATPETERKVADDKLKKQRTKRRSAWRKGP